MTYSRNRRIPYLLKCREDFAEVYNDTEVKVDDYVMLYDGDEKFFVDVVGMNRWRLKGLITNNDGKKYDDIIMFRWSNIFCHVGHD